MQQLLKNPKTVFVDVRTDWEYRQEHLPNAVHIPLEEVAFRMEDLKKMEGPLVLYCRSGNRSGMAVRMLTQAGLKDVYNGGGLTELKYQLLN